MFCHAISHRLRVCISEACLGPYGDPIFYKNSSEKLLTNLSPQVQKIDSLMADCLFQYLENWLR